MRQKLNTGLVDEREIFPTNIFGGLARMTISNPLPDICLLGVLSRGYNQISMMAMRNGRKFRVEASFSITKHGTAYMRSLFMLGHKTQDEFGTRNVIGKPLYESCSEDRIMLCTTRDRLRRAFAPCLQPIAWNKEMHADAVNQIDEMIRMQGLQDGFVGKRSHGPFVTVIPMGDYLNDSGETKRMAA